ncbi:unnamed protein product [Natator depressus]
MPFSPLQEQGAHLSWVVSPWLGDCGWQLHLPSPPLLRGPWASAFHLSAPVMKAETRGQKRHTFKNQFGVSKSAFFAEKNQQRCVWKIFAQLQWTCKFPGVFVSNTARVETLPQSQIPSRCTSSWFH